MNKIAENFSVIIDLGKNAPDPDVVEYMIQLWNEALGRIQTPTP